MSSEWKLVWLRTLTSAVPTSGRSRDAWSGYRHTDDDGWAVLAWSGLGTGRPRLTAVYMGVGALPEAGNLPLLPAPPSGAVTTALLRSLNLTQATADFLTKIAAEETAGTQPWEFSDIPRELITTEAAKALGFRSVTDLRAAVERLEVAFAYAHVASAGSAKPVADIAAQLKLPVETVRVRLQRARNDGYLTRVAHGKIGGEVTDRGRQLNAHLVLYGEKHTGQWLSDELRQAIVDDALSDPTVMWDEDIERDR